MTDNYFRYLLAITHTPLPFHTFVFIITVKTIPNFMIRFPYLMFRILTLPIAEIGSETRFYPYLFQISEYHMRSLLFSGATDLNQFAQYAIDHQPLFNEPDNQLQPQQQPQKGKKPAPTSQSNDLSLFNIKELFTKEEQDSIDDVFRLLSLPNIPLDQQQISLLNFSFWMKLLGVVPLSVTTEALYLVLRQFTTTTSKNKNKNQLSPDPLAQYNIPAAVWKSLQEEQLTLPQRNLLSRFNEFKQQQDLMLSRKRELEQKQRGFFDRILTSTKLWAPDSKDTDYSKALSTPVYAGITWSVYSEFVTKYGCTSAALQQQFSIMLAVSQQDEEDKGVVDDHPDKRHEIYHHLKHNNYIDHDNPENPIKHALSSTSTTSSQSKATIGTLSPALFIQDGYKRYVVQQHRILVERFADYQRLYYYYTPNTRLSHTPEADEYVPAQQMSDLHTSTSSSSHSSQQQQQQQQSIPPLQHSASLRSLSTTSAPPPQSILPTHDPQNPLLWQMLPFFAQLPKQPSAMMDLSPHSIAAAPALYPHYTPHEYYNAVVREKGDILSNNMIIYCTKGFDRSEFVVSGKCCLTLDSFIFIPLVSKTVIPYNSIVKIQLVPQGGVAATIRSYPYLLITYATQVKDSTVTFTSSGNEQADHYLHMLERQGNCYHDKIYIDSDDVYLLFAILCDMVSITRIKDFVHSSEMDITKANELSFASAVINAMVRYHEAEKDVYRNVQKMEAEIKSDEFLLSPEHRAKVNALSLTTIKTMSGGEASQTSRPITSTPPPPTTVPAVSTAPTKQLSTASSIKDTMTPAQREELKMAKFLEKRQMIRSTMALLKLPSFKHVVGELLVLYKQLHHKYASSSSSSSSSSSLSSSSANNTTDSSLSSIGASSTDLSSFSNSMTQPLSSPSLLSVQPTPSSKSGTILAKSISPSDTPNFLLQQLLQPLVHYDHEAYQQFLLTKSIKSSKSPTVSKIDQEIITQQHHSSSQSQQLQPSSPQSPQSPLPFIDSKSSTSASSPPTPPFNLIPGQPIQLTKDERFFEIDYSLPVPDGVYPPLSNTKTQSILKTIPDWKHSKMQLVGLMYRDVLNAITAMISVYYMLQQQHIVSPLPIQTVLSALSPMRAVVLTPQREVIKTMKMKKGVSQTTTAQFDLRDVFYKGREQQQHALVLQSIQHLISHVSERTYNHIKDFININSAFVYSAAQQSFSLTSLKSPNPTGIMGSSATAASFTLHPSSFNHEDAKYPGLTADSFDRASAPTVSKSGADRRSEEVSQKHEKSLQYNQVIALQRQKYHFIDQCPLHSPEYTETMDSFASIEYQPWVVSVINHALLEQRAAEFLVKVYQTKLAFERTIKPVPIQARKSITAATLPQKTLSSGPVPTSPTSNQVDTRLSSTQPFTPHASPVPSGGMTFDTTPTTPNPDIFNLSMTKENISDLTLFEYTTYLNKHVDEQYFAYQVYTQDSITFERQQNELIEQRVNKKIARLRALERQSGGKIIQNSTQLVDTSSSSSSDDSDDQELAFADFRHHSDDDDDDDDDADDDDESPLFSYKDELSTLTQRGSTIQSVSHLNLDLEGNIPRPTQTPQTPRQLQQQQQQQQQQQPTALTQSPPTKTTNDRFASYGFRPGGGTLKGSGVSTTLSPLQSPPQSLRNMLKTAEDEYRHTYQLRAYSSGMLVVPPSILTPQDYRTLHQFWFYQQQAHIQGHFQHIADQQKRTTDPTKIVGGLSLWFVTFLSHPSYLHTIPSHQHVQHLQYQQSHLQPFCFHAAKEQAIAAGEEMVITPRSIGDGTMAVLDILREYNLNKFTIRSGIDTILMTKLLVDPIFILVKLSKTITTWKHPSVTATILFLLLWLCWMDMLFLLVPMIIVLLITFLLCQKTQPFFLELFVAPWTEGQVPMVSKYRDLAKTMVPNPSLGGLYVPATNLLTSEEKYKMIDIDALKPRQRARYVYFAVRGQDYWGTSLRKYHSDDPEATNLAPQVPALSANTISPNDLTTPTDIHNNDSDTNEDNILVETITPLVVLGDQDSTTPQSVLSSPDSKTKAMFKDDIPETLRVTSRLDDMITTESHFGTSTPHPQPSQPTTIPKPANTFQLEDGSHRKKPQFSPTTTQPVELIHSQPATVSSQQFLNEFKPQYNVIAVATTNSTKGGFFDAISNISSQLSKINTAYSKATTIQHTLTGINHHLMKIQGMFRWTTPPTTNKLIAVLCAAVCVLLVIPFRIIFAIAMIDVFTKPWQTPPSFLQRLINDVEVATGHNYTFVNDEDINKIFPKLAKVPHDAVKDPEEHD